MNSIRRKLFFQIGSITLLLVLLIYLANSFLLEPFYTQISKKDLLTVYNEVNRLNTSDYNSDALYNISISGRNHYDILVFDLEKDIVYSPKNPILGPPHENTSKPPKTPDSNLPDSHIIFKEQHIDNDLSFLWIKDERTNISFLAIKGPLNNGNIVTIQIPLHSIIQNIEIMNDFILIIGIIMFFISLIAANIISKHFTKPILNILDVTKNIRQLNFAKICKVMTNDEIGRLSENINEMSYALKDSMAHLEEKNEQLNIEIEERMKIDEQRKALLNNVSHELKTPLSLLQGYSEGLKLNLHKKPEKIDFYCDVIQDEAKKMDALVSQLLDMNRIQSGNFSLYKETTGAKEFLSYIINKYQSIFHEQDIAFSSDIDTLDNDLVLHIDSLRSEQVLTNLLNNAIAYVDSRKQIGLHAEINNDHLQITLSNTCEAISEEEIEQLWHSFYKIDQARTRENGGYGLGLSIIKAIQEADNNTYGVNFKNGLINFYVDFDLSLF